MARKILSYVVSVDIKYEESVPQRQSRELILDKGEGDGRNREYGWVDPPDGAMEIKTNTETVYAQTVDTLNIGDIAAVVNKLAAK